MIERAIESTSSELFEWEVEAEFEREKYFRGKELIKSFANADPTDTFALQELSEHLSKEELEAYIFAWEHDEKHRQDKRRQAARLVAEAIAGSGLRTPSELAPQGAQNASLDNDAELQEVIARFLATGQRAPSTIRSYKQKLALFRNIIKAHTKGKEPRISRITPGMIRQYSDCVRRLPKSFQLVSGKPVTEALVDPVRAFLPKRFLAI